MIWNIEIVTVAHAATPGPEVFFQRGFGDWVDIAIHIFVLRGAAGVVLIDTGLIADTAPLNAVMRRNKGDRAGFRPTGATIDAGLSESMTAVVLTSLGPYAAGGVAHQRGDVPIYASARGLADLHLPEEPCLRHPLPDRVTRRLASAIPIHGGCEILPGIRAFEVGVHHPASIAVEIDTALGRIVIADPVFSTANLTRPVALGAAENAAAWFDMVRRFANRDAAFLPIHDPAPRPIRVQCQPDGTWSATEAGPGECP